MEGAEEPNSVEGKVSKETLFLSTADRNNEFPIRQYEADKRAESAEKQLASSKEIEELKNKHAAKRQLRRIWTHILIAAWVGLIALAIAAVESNYCPWEDDGMCAETHRSQQSG